MSSTKSQAEIIESDSERGWVLLTDETDTGAPIIQPDRDTDNKIIENIAVVEPEI